MNTAARRALLGEPSRKLPDAQRTRRAVDTLELLRPLLWERFGITRLATVTGLDRIGIPVVMAVRPNSRSLAVSQGKGVTPDDARASALMESVELWHAEEHRVPTRSASWADLVAAAADDGAPPVADPNTLPLSFESVWNPERSIPWCLGTDVHTGRSTFVPYELVHADARVPPYPGSGCFSRNTTGLASGNTSAEALLHGLCEIIERDAGALHEIDVLHQPERRLAIGSVDDPTACALLERYASADIDVIAWDVTSDIDVATFHVVISDRLADPVLRPLPAAFGAGTHPDRGVALVRALTEAAQSRLTAISGARDDLRRARYRASQSQEALVEYAALAREPGKRQFRAVPTFRSVTVDDDIDHVLARLDAAGAGPVIAVDLSCDDLPVHVVRTVVGGLESAIQTPSYRPGPRARRLLRQLGSMQ